MFVCWQNWWTHLWLKEGFATWIEYLCVDHCFPEFDIWTQFISYDLGRAFDLDALDNSHPIEIEVGNPSEVDEIFDTISYCKGASIIRMLHDFVGDDVSVDFLSYFPSEYWLVMINTYIVLFEWQHCTRFLCLLSILATKYW